MRTTIAFCLLALLLTAVPASAKEGEPTAAEIAKMILDGNAGEHALVAAWLDKQDKAFLIAVFKELRGLKAKRAPRPTLTRTVKTRKERGFRMPLPEKVRQPRKGKQRVVNAEVRVIDIAAPGVEGFLGTRRPTSKRNAIALTAAQAGTLLRAVEKSERAKLVSAPRITVYDGQKANVSVLNQISYVKDYDVEVAKDGSTLADPVVDVLQEGTVIDFRPTCEAGAQRIGMEFTGTFAAVQRPIPEIDLAIADGEGGTVKIQVPQVRVSRIQTTVTLPDGGWVLIGGGVILEPKKGEAVERVTLVHLKSLQLDASPSRDPK